MTTRIAVGLLGLAILLPAVVWGGELAVEVIVAIALVICLDEYTRMAFPSDRTASMLWMVTACGMAYVARIYLGGTWADVVPVMVVMATFCWVLFRPGADLERASTTLGRYLIGLCWIGGLLPCLVELRRLDDGLGWVVSVLVVSWMGDTGAYFAGKFLGRKKLYPLVSPKKTWAGVVGGVLAAIAGVFVVRALGLLDLTLVDCIVIGGAGCAMGVVGDLCESLLKRAYGVKDSGWIMPGHGGLLDRIDSVMFVAPTVLVWAVVVKGYSL